MNVIARPPAMSREQFLDWVQHREGRFELDHGQPVAMTGGSRRHNLIALNLSATLRAMLRGTEFQVLAIDVGIATGAVTVRYPDVMVTASRGAGTDLLVDDVVLAFEVVSPASGRNDRITKLREYLGVPSIQRYVIVEQTSAALTVFERDDTGAGWRATAILAGETLELPEFDIGLPMADIYDGVDLPDEPQQS